MLSIKEISQRLGVNEETVRRWIRSGNLEAHQIGRTYCVNEESLKSFIQEKDGVIGTLGHVAIGATLGATIGGPVGSAVGGFIGSLFGQRIYGITNSILEKDIEANQKIEQLERTRRKLSMEYELLDFELEQQIKELKETKR